MGRKNARRRLNRLLKSLDREDRDRLINYAKRLSDGEQTAKGTDGSESLVPNDHTPSYTAAVDEGEYQRRRQDAGRSDVPDDMTP